MGVDAGGLFKEFMTKLTDEIFDPQYGFFEENQRESKMFPNVVAAQNDPDFRMLFQFFGMIVGKAIFEGVLLKCRFARFFINKLVNRSNQVDELKGIDE